MYEVLHVISRVSCIRYGMASMRYGMSYGMSCMSSMRYVMYEISHVLSDVSRMRYGMSYQLRAWNVCDMHLWALSRQGKR